MLMSTFPCHASVAVVLLFSFAVANKANSKVFCVILSFPHIVTFTMCVVFLFDRYKE